MINLNGLMKQSLQQAQQRAAEEIRQQQARQAADQAAAKKRQAELNAQEARRKEEEARRVEQEAEKNKVELQEKQRVNDLLQRAVQESNGILDGTNNIQAIFNEKDEVVSKFLETKPLEGAIIANALDAVKLLVSKGQSYDSWRDIVDENTPLYDFLATKFKASTPRIG